MKKKSASQIAQKLSKKVILFAITALALCASPGSRGIEVCNQQLFSTWTNLGAGDWFISSNWCGGVPISHSFTCISNGGTAQISSSDPIAEACETFVGQYQCDPACQNSGLSGNLSVDGGTLNTGNELHVGYHGKGTLKITNGGLVSTTGGADIAAGAGSSGAATADGATSQWTATEGLYVGGVNGSAGGTGLLTLTNGGKVNVTNVYVYKSGTLTGNGRVGATNGTTIEGTLAPNWTLNIDGNLIFAGDTALMQCNVTSANLNSVDAEVSGAATLNGKLSVTLNGFFTGDFTLLHASTLHNQFASYSFTYTGCLVPSIRYIDGDVILHVESNCQ